MKTIELHSAFVFDCDHCGTENLVRAIEALMDEATSRRVAKEQVAIHYDTVGNVREDGSVEAEYVITRVTIAPRKVQCYQCGAEYAVDLWSEDRASELPQ